jgi:hypothetical protein
MFKLMYKTTVKLTGGKKNEMQNRITKVTTAFVDLNRDSIYETEMKEKDPTFVSKPRAWGVRREDGWIEHKGVLYNDFIVREYINSFYFLDEEPIDEEKIIGLPAPSKVPEMVLAIKLDNIIILESMDE